MATNYATVLAVAKVFLSGLRLLQDLDFALIDYETICFVSLQAALLGYLWQLDLCSFVSLTLYRDLSASSHLVYDISSLAFSTSRIETLAGF